MARSRRKCSIQKTYSRCGYSAYYEPSDVIKYCVDCAVPGAESYHCKHKSDHHG